MGVFSGLYKIIKKLLGIIILPIFKFLRKILWDWTLRKFFNDVLKLKFIVSLIDDFLNVIEISIKEPKDLLKMSNNSIIIIFLPLIINILLIPFNRKKQEYYYPEYQQYPQQYSQQYPQQYQNNIIQKGGFILKSLSKPNFKTFIGLFISIYILYFYEKKELCEKKPIKEEDKNKSKWDTWNLIKYSFWISIITLIYYSMTLYIFPYIPILGIFYSIFTIIPIIGPLIPNILTYFTYNIIRNIGEIMETRTHCTKK